MNLLRRQTTSRIGVDIGATAVRAVVVSDPDDDQYVEVMRSAKVELPHGAVSGGELSDIVAVASAMTDALEQLNGSDGYVVALTARSAAVGLRTVPSTVPPAERVEYLRTADLPPISNLITLDQAHVQTQLARRLNIDGKDLDRLAVALVPPEAVERLQEACAATEKEPAAIDLGASGLLRAVCRTYGNPDEVETIVDIGATKTQIVTREGGHMRSARLLPHGGDAITKALMGPLDASFADAEERKKILRVASAPDQAHATTSLYLDNVTAERDRRLDTDLGQTLAQAAEQLVDEIDKTIRTEANQSGGRRPDRILLTGGGAHLRGLVELVWQSSGIETRLGRPWITVENPSANGPLYNADGTENTAEVFGFATAIGMALWERADEVA